MAVHEITQDGESTANWAISQPGFLGTAAQLLNCARCGERLPPKPYDHPRHFSVEPWLHVLCDDCYDALPD